MMKVAEARGLKRMGQSAAATAVAAMHGAVRLQQLRGGIFQRARLQQAFGGSFDQVRRLGSDHSDQRRCMRRIWTISPP